MKGALRFVVAASVLALAAPSWAQSTVPPPPSGPPGPLPCILPPDAALAPPLPSEAPATNASPPAVRVAQTALPLHVEARADGRPQFQQQGSAMLSLSWDVSYPVGSLHHFIGEMSFRGIEGDLRVFVLPHLSVGVGAAWQLYTQTRDYSTYDYAGGAVSATLYRSTETFLLRFSAHYFPLDTGPVRPFVGVVMGPSSVNFESLAADLSLPKSVWSFAMQPEAGVLIGTEQTKRFYGIIMSFRYSYSTASFATVSEVQSIGGQLGTFLLF